MNKYTIPIFALLLIPSLSFAATPNEQYISFLRQEIAVLQSELDLLASTTPTAATTTPQRAIIPAPWTAPSACGGSHNVAQLYEEGIDCTPPEFSE